MNYKVKLFAILKSKVGQELWEHESNEALKASELLKAFFSKFKDLKGLEKATRIAVNQSFCSEDLLVNDSDELAFIPPVSGG